jgi:hypothetical protein
MAKLFPHAYVLGVDAAPNQLDSALVPWNVSFEVDNINEGLRHYHGDHQFDLIHMRMVQSGVVNIQALLVDLQACLRPGGLLIVIDMTPELYDQHRNIVPMAKLSTDDDEGAVSQTGSWLARFLFGMHLFTINSLTSHNITEVNDASHYAGVNMARGNALIDTGFWDEEELDRSTAMSGSIYLPVGSWGSCTENKDHSQALKEAGTLVRKAFMGICDAHVPWLKEVYDLSTQMLDEWEQNIARGMWPCGSCYACNEITMFRQRSVMRDGITQFDYSFVVLDDVIVPVSPHPIPLQQWEYQVWWLVEITYLWSKYSTCLLKHTMLCAEGKPLETYCQDQPHRMHLVQNHSSSIFHRCHCSS